MGFADDMQRFTDKVQRRARDIHRRSVDLVFESIVEGSPVTGAPGQPVSTGGPAKLKRSWRKEPEGIHVTSVVTDVDYAPNVEDAIGNRGQPIQLRSAVGGFHSVALTRAGWPRIVDTVAREVSA